MVQNRLLELPAVPQFEGRDPFLINILVQGFPGNPKIFGSLPDTSTIIPACTKNFLVNLSPDQTTD